MDEQTGDLLFERWYDEVFLENDQGSNQEKTITTLVKDSGTPARWTTVDITLRFNYNEWSGSAPMFPIPYYKQFVTELTSNGSTLLQVDPTNKLGKKSSEWFFELVHNDEIFSIDNRTGAITLNGELDYEAKTEYEFNVNCWDTQGRLASVSVYIYVIGVDEHAPVFSRPTYTFTVRFYL